MPPLTNTFTVAGTVVNVDIRPFRNGKGKIVIVRLDGEYPDTYKGDTTAKPTPLMVESTFATQTAMAGWQPGDRVCVSGHAKANEWNGKYFTHQYVTTIVAVEKAAAKPTPPSPTRVADADVPPPGLPPVPRDGDQQQPDDDIPF